MALFFKHRKPRGFNYQPRFYDPDAEAREERKKIVLGERYKAPQKNAPDTAAASTCQATGNPDSAVEDHGSSTRAKDSNAGGNDSRARTCETNRTDTPSDYVPGALLREHIAARRGNANVAGSMRRRRRKPQSMIVLAAVLAALAYLVWMWYFKK